MDIEEIIPHRDRMKLVEKVTGLDRNSATTLSTVTDKWPLCDHRGINCLVSIELVAQTSALAIGWEVLQSKSNDDMQGKGWLVGIKEASFNREIIPLNTKITTRAEITLNMNNYSEVNGYTSMENEQLSTIKLQVLRMDKEAGGE